MARSDAHTHIYIHRHTATGKRTNALCVHRANASEKKKKSRVRAAQFARLKRRGEREETRKRERERERERESDYAMLCNANNNSRLKRRPEIACDLKAKKGEEETRGGKWRDGGLKERFTRGFTCPSQTQDIRQAEHSSPNKDETHTHRNTVRWKLDEGERQMPLVTTHR